MSRWTDKADALYRGWILASGAPPPTFNALRLVLAQAQFETQCGDAWDHSHNWGACDLRGLTASERLAFGASVLQIGMWLFADGTFGPIHRPDAIGTIRGDSDPNSGAFKVWFAAFPTDPLGAAYMLRAGVRRAAHVFDATPAAPVVYSGPAMHEVHAILDEGANPIDYAQALYLQGYFGGVHAGSRPVGERSLPLNAAECANLTDYTNAISRQLPAIDDGLKDWNPPDAFALSGGSGEIVTNNAGGESAPTTNVGTDETIPAPPPTEEK